jgi:sulfur-carrier protein
MTEGLYRQAEGLKSGHGPLWKYPAMSQQITILYFGHLVEMLNRDSEYLFLPLTVKTLGDLMQHLARRGDAWAEVFAEPKPSMRVTVNKAFVEPDAPVKAGDEVAFVAFTMT